MKLLVEKEAQKYPPIDSLKSKLLDMYRQSIFGWSNGDLISTKQRNMIFVDALRIRTDTIDAYQKDVKTQKAN